MIDRDYKDKCDKECVCFTHVELLKLFDKDSLQHLEEKHIDEHYFPGFHCFNCNKYYKNKLLNQE